MPFPVDVQYIKETEKELKLEFPDKFKARMLEMNGGEIETDDDAWELFPFFDKSDKKRMSRTSNHIVLETKEARAWDNFPQDAVAIASNGCGDFLVLLPMAVGNHKLNDAVYLWLHETGGIEKVADSIDELED